MKGANLPRKDGFLVGRRNKEIIVLFAVLYAIIPIIWWFGLDNLGPSIVDEGMLLVSTVLFYSVFFLVFITRKHHDIAGLFYWLIALLTFLITTFILSMRDLVDRHVDREPPLPSSSDLIISGTFLLSSIIIMAFLIFFTNRRLEMILKKRVALFIGW